ncbi:pancreatic triacylglycerol lipase-like [Harmonia axyridis]|uniref:pancreatic triacylglycerol lipase-like n=1 Tax=Harmonia axyridis TaxID=115357 RepID=UPI001E274E15|nr:pancreatic triacylglycerol lipase-like [Harmonia axyridis]
MGKRIFSLILVLNFGHSFKIFDVVPPNLFNFPQQLQENTSNAFLGTLFNSSLSNVLQVADRFKFCNADLGELRFLLYTANQSDPRDVNLKMMKMDMDSPTKILIHGWFGTGNNEFIKKLANQYHKKGKYNVIGLDWSKHSKKDYIRSSCTTRDIGKAISKFVLEMLEGDVTKLVNIHLIGHSLGAQVAAFAGKDMLDKTGRKIGRITGLDAAAPLFEFPLKAPEHLRLHSEDAEVVDGIHTNMGFFGFASAYGTADFFVDNGSPVQPGCNRENFFEDLVCSHGRAVDLYQESIISRKLVGLECPNPFVYRIGLCSRGKRAVMGEESPRNVRGSYFLETFDRAPFGKG